MLAIPTGGPTGSSIVAGLVLGSLACGQTPASPPDAGLIERVRVTMGSDLKLTAVAADEAAAVSAFEEVFAEFERLDALMSVWREGSDVLRLNAAAGRRPVKVSAEVLEVLRIARQVSEVDRGKIRRHIRPAYGPLEVRPRSRQPDSRQRKGAAASTARRLSSARIEQ